MRTDCMSPTFNRALGFEALVGERRGGQSVIGEPVTDGGGGGKEEADGDGLEEVSWALWQVIRRRMY